MGSLLACKTPRFTTMLFSCMQIRTIKLHAVPMTKGNALVMPLGNYHQMIVIVWTIPAWPTPLTGMIAEHVVGRIMYLRWDGNGSKLQFQKKTKQIIFCFPTINFGVNNFELHITIPSYVHMLLMDHGIHFLKNLPDPPYNPPASWAEALYRGAGQEGPKKMRPMRDWTEN